MVSSQEDETNSVTCAEPGQVKWIKVWPKGAHWWATKLPSQAWQQFEAPLTYVRGIQICLICHLHMCHSGIAFSPACPPEQVCMVHHSSWVHMVMQNHSNGQVSGQGGVTKHEAETDLHWICFSLFKINLWALCLLVAEYSWDKKNLTKNKTNLQKYLAEYFVSKATQSGFPLIIKLKIC